MNHSLTGTPCISAPCSSVLLPYCQTSASPFWPRFTQGRCWIIWSSGLPQWRTMGGSGVSAESEHGAIGRPGKSCTMPHAPTQPSTSLCKARPSWKRTYFAPRCQFAQNGQIFPGKKESGVRAGTWETGNGGQRDKPRHKRAAWEYFPHNELFICSRHLARGLNNDGIITE